MTTELFPFYEYWWFYLSFSGFVLVLLALDLGLFHRKAHAVTFREALFWSAAWIVLALVFNYLFYLYARNVFSLSPRLLVLPGFEPDAAAKQVALEFLAGYVVEKSLSVDNLFVFVVLFNFFAIDRRYQHRVLFYGIIGALIFRSCFIALGSVLMQYEAVVFIFGLFLIFTGLKVFFDEGKKSDPGKNPVIRMLAKYLPVTKSIHGQKLFTRAEGRWLATPLFVALLAIEVSDIVFAVDSVPAIFALTREPLVVFTSNVFAILGLRALYFILSAVVHKFHLLQYGLGIVLVFVGLKMVWLNHYFGGKFPITISLSVILAVLLLSVVLSLLFPKKEEPVES